MGVRLSVHSPEHNENINFEFDQERIVIGRGVSCDVQLPHRGVSHHHAVIQSQFPDYVIEDVGSTNGTRVNGAPLVSRKSKVLRSFDRIEIGSITLRFEASVPISLPTSAERTCSLARRLLREVLFDSGTFSPPRLTVETGPLEGTSVELASEGATIRVGRDETCELRIDDVDISREHAVFERDKEGVVVRDLGSKNGILVNQRQIREKRLRHLDEVQIGVHRIRFEDTADAEVQQMQSEPDLLLEPQPKAGFDQSTEVLEPRDHEPTYDQRQPDATGSVPRHADVDTRSVGSDPRRMAGRSGGADALIYLLALIVFALSVVGLFALLSASE